GGCFADFPPTVKRVKGKEIGNGQGQTQRIVYDYSGSTPKAMTKEIHNSDWGEPERPTYCGEHKHSIACSSHFDNYEFLGFDKVSVLSYDYSGNLLTKTTNYYYQLNTDPSCGCQTGGRLEPCAMVHPARGRSYQTQLYENNSNLVRESKSTFLPTDLSSFCEYYTYDNLPLVAEKETLAYGYNPANINDKKITKIENDNLDDHGRFQKTIDWGEVTASGTDVDSKDTRMTWTNYLWNDSYKIGKPESIEVYQGSQKQTANLLNINYFQYKEITAGGPALGDPIASHTFLWTGNPTFSQLPTPGNPQGTTLITTRQDFDDYGNRKSVTDAENHTTRTDYDDFYHSRIIKVTDPYGDTVENRYGEGGSLYQILGLPKEVIDQNHQVTSYDFDSFGRLKTQTNPADREGEPTQQVSYNKDSQGRYIVTTQTRKDQGGSSPAYYVSSSSFTNGLGEIIQAQTEGDNRLIIADTKYNAQGKVEKQTLPWEGDKTQAGYYQSPNWSKVTTTTYDFLGRPRIVTNPDSTTSETVYDDFQRTVTTFDALRHKATQYADVRGNTIRTEGYTGTGNYQLYSTTTSLYDTLGRLTNITDNDGNQTTIVYDSLGRVRERTDPDLGKWLYPEYDKNGNLLLHQDARGKRIRFEYDSLNRLTKKTWLDERNKVFTYDFGHTGGITGNNRIGKLWKRSDPNGNFWEATNYDTNGRLTNEKYHLYDQDYSFSYSYDAQDRLTNLTYSDNEQLKYEYSNQGLSKVSSQTNDNVFVNNRVYSLNSQLTYEDVGNNMRRRYTYDPDNLRLLIASTEYDPRNPGKANLPLFHYNYDPIGNITLLSDLGNSTKFTYDDFSRLTNAWGLFTYNASYTYDPLGNLVTKKEGEENLTLTYNNSQPVHAPKSVNDQQLEYDEVGNLKSWLSDGFKSITWNTENKPTRIEKTNGRTLTFEYDGSGNLTKKELNRGADVGKETIVYIGNYLEKKTSVIYGKTTTETTKYYFVGGERLALRRDGGNYPGLYFIHTDHLGSFSRITPEGDKPFPFLGQDYYPYGSIRTGHKPYYLTDKFFTGQARDEETGLDYFKARFYSPKLGRFISADTAQGANRYAYADNNPMNIIDPVGHQGWYFGLANLLIKGGFAAKLSGAYGFLAGLAAKAAGFYGGYQSDLIVRQYEESRTLTGAPPLDPETMQMLEIGRQTGIDVQRAGEALMGTSMVIYGVGELAQLGGTYMKRGAPALGIVANADTGDDISALFTKTDKGTFIKSSHMAKTRDYSIFTGDDVTDGSGKAFGKGRYLGWEGQGEHGYTRDVEGLTNKPVILAEQGELYGKRYITVYVSPTSGGFKNYADPPHLEFTRQHLEWLVKQYDIVLMLSGNPDYRQVLAVGGQIIYNILQ
ncbi:RHS repeat-associated core domain-containing protein, partial [Candidatus Gottesmanbacteria bacterium]|nr:RHS repeat-associated core domain-containing protein [Candidatus Gottesmanbacteria bacterium]